MSDRLIAFLVVIFKIFLHIVIGSFIITHVFPDSLGTLILILYYCYIFGKLICGGFSTKNNNKDE